MFKPSLLVPVVVLVGALSVLACKAPFSPPPPDGDHSPLHISPAGMTIEAGTTLQLYVSVAEGSNRDVASSDVQWVSSNPNTAVVTHDGVVMGLAAGRADIIAEFDGFKAVATIAVTQAPRTCAPGLRVPIQCPTL